MEKEMLAIAKFKSGEGKFEKFMGWMQSDEGMEVRKTIAHVEKTVPAIAPDKSYVMFKVSVHNEEEMKKFVTGQNPVAKPIRHCAMECGQALFARDECKFDSCYGNHICFAVERHHARVDRTRCHHQACCECRL